MRTMDEKINTNSEEDLGPDSEEKLKKLIDDKKAETEAFKKILKSIQKNINPKK
jgi:hypothetical protein